MRTLLKYLFLLSILFATNCSEEKDEEVIIIEEKIATITAIDQNLKDAQIATILVEDFTLDQETYAAKFGDIDIILVKNNSSELSFLIPPNTATGTYNLSLAFSSNSIDFRVTKTTLLETPEKVILNFVGDYVNEIDETIALFTQGNIPPELFLVKDNMVKAIAEINSLSDNDKIIVAKFIKNNTTDLDLLSAELTQEDLIYASKSLIKKCTSPRCYFAYGVKVLAAAALIDVGGKVAVIGAAIIGIDAIISLIRGKQSVLISKVKKVVKEGLDISIFWQSTLLEATYNEADNSIFNSKSNKKSNKIDNKTTLSFKIKPTIRTLNASDENSTDEIVSNFVAAYSKFKEIWNENFASKLGSFPNFNTNEEQQEAEELSQFSLEITKNGDKVSLSDIKGTAKEFSTTFTNKTDIDQDFDLDIIFEEGDIVAKTSISFKIGFDKIFVEKVSGDNQKGIQNEVLEKPIVVKVVDKDGNGIMDVEVEFVITEGGGKLSSASVKTGANGLAQVSWTLGDNLDKQSLEVLVKDSANENISTSPLTFTATSEEVELFLEKVSGDNQTGEKNKALDNPLVVKIKDKDGNGIENSIVEFNITKGNGSLSSTSVQTNNNGNAQVSWTLGDDVDNQSVEVIVKKGDGTSIDGSPVIFNANTNINLLGTWFDPEVDGTETENYGEQCNDIYNNTARYLSVEINFSNNTGISKNIYELTEYPNSICTANGWNLGQQIITIDTETGPFNWSLNGTTLTLIFDNGTDPYPFKLEIIDMNNIKLISIDDPGDDDILLRRK